MTEEVAAEVRRLQTLVTSPAVRAVSMWSENIGDLPAAGGLAALAGGVLPGYQGVIVRDGYAGYGHLTDALHAWCGVHLLRAVDAQPVKRQQDAEHVPRMAVALARARRQSPSRCSPRRSAS